MSNNENPMLVLREITSLVNHLLGAVKTLSAEVARSEIENLAIGNLLIKKGILTKEELESECSLMLLSREKEFFEKNKKETESGALSTMVNEFKKTINNANQGNSIRKQGSGHNSR